MTEPGLVVAALLVAAATWLSVPATTRLRGRGRPTLATYTSSMPVLAACGWAGAVLLGGKGLALGAVVAIVGYDAARLLRRDRDRKRADETRRIVVDVCESLAGEVRAGRGSVRALTETAAQFPLVSESAAAAELGGDIPTALRSVAAAPGAAALLAVAAAWEVSLVSGAPLGDALERSAEIARAELATAAMVASELSTARATARLLAILPLFVLTLTRGLGFDPWDFLLTTWIGLGCLTLGSAFALTGLHWVDRVGEAALR
jgi:tight adherence protein B